MANSYQELEYLRKMLERKRKSYEYDSFVNPSENDYNDNTDTTDEEENSIYSLAKIKTDMQTKSSTQAPTVEQKDNSPQNVMDYWKRTSDTIAAAGINVTRGLFNFFDSLGDLFFNAADAIGGGNVDWAQNARDYDWVSYATNAVNFIGELPNGGVFNGDWARSFNSLEETQAYLDKVVNESNWLSEAQGANNFISGVEESIGFMLPSIIAAVVTGGATASATAASGASQAAAAAAAAQAAKATALGVMAGGSFASSYNETYKETGNVPKSLVVGSLKAGVEVGTELIFPEGKVMGVIGGKTVTSGFKQFAKAMGREFLEEGVEECLSALAEPFINEIYKEGSIKNAYIDNPAAFFYGGNGGNFNESVAGQGLAGGVSGILMGGVSQVQTNAAIDRLVGKDGRALLAKGQELNDVASEYFKDAEKGKLTDEELKTKYEDLFGEKGAEWMREWANLKSKLTTKQKENFAKLIANPTETIRQEIQDNDESYSQFIEKTIKNRSDISKVQASSLTEYINQQFKTDLKLDYINDDLIQNRDELQKYLGYDLTDEEYNNLLTQGEAFNEKGKTVVLNEKYKNDYNRLVAHEALSHGILDSNTTLRDNLINEFKNNKEFFNAWKEYFKNAKNTDSIVDLYDLPQDLKSVNVLSNEYYNKYTQAIETMNSEQMASFVEFALSNKNLFNVLSRTSQNNIRTFLRRAIEKLTGKSNDALSKARTLLENTLKEIKKSGSATNTNRQQVALSKSGSNEYRTEEQNKQYNKNLEHFRNTIETDSTKRADRVKNGLIVQQEGSNEEIVNDINHIKNGKVDILTNRYVIVDNYQLGSLDFVKSIQVNKNIKIDTTLPLAMEYFRLQNKLNHKEHPMTSKTFLQAIEAIKKPAAILLHSDTYNKQNWLFQTNVKNSIDGNYVQIYINNNGKIFDTVTTRQVNANVITNIFARKGVNLTEWLNVYKNEICYVDESQLKEMGINIKKDKTQTLNGINVLSSVVLSNSIIKDNGLVVNSENENVPRVVKILDYEEELAKAQKAADENYKNGQIVFEQLSKKYKTSNISELQQLIQDKRGNSEDKRALANLISYDKEYSKNKKIVTNLTNKLNSLGVNTNKNNNVKFSLGSKTDSEGHKLSKGQQKFFKDSKMRDRDGYLASVYHFSSSFEPFTVFDDFFNDYDQKGFYFASNKRVAKTYQKVGVKFNRQKTAELANKYGIDLRYNSKTKEFNIKHIAKEILSGKITEQQIFDYTDEARRQHYDRETFDFNDVAVLAKREGTSNEWDRLYSPEDVDKYNDNKRIGIAVYFNITDAGGTQETSFIYDYNDFETQLEETYGIGFNTYLNAKNPLVIEGNGNRWDSIKTNIEGLEKAKTREIANYAYENGYDGVIFRDIFDMGGHQDFLSSDEMTMIEQGTLSESSMLFQALTDVYVVFKPNQIKNVGNLNPTKKNDIRFSIAKKTDSQGKELSKDQQEYFRDSKVRDEKGNLKVMYHGTSDTNFTVFDKSMSQDAFFFTDDKLNAESYTTKWQDNEIIKTYLNLTNPYIVDAKNSMWDEIDFGKTKKEGITTWGNAKKLIESGKINTFEQFRRLLYSIEPFYAPNDLEWHIKGEMANGKTYREVEKEFFKDPIAVAKELEEYFEIEPDYTVLLGDYTDNVKTHDIPDYSTTRDVVKKVLDMNKKGSNYDGIIFDRIIDYGDNSLPMARTPHQVVAVFEPSQIKNIDNANPTSSPDIRFSKSKKKVVSLSDTRKAIFEHSPKEKVYIYNQKNGKFTEDFAKKFEYLGHDFAYIKKDGKYYLLDAESGTLFKQPFDKVSDLANEVYKLQKELATIVSMPEETALQEKLKKHIDKQNKKTTETKKVESVKKETTKKTTEKAVEKKEVAKPVVEQKVEEEVVSTQKTKASSVRESKYYANLYGQRVVSYKNTRELVDNISSVFEEQLGTPIPDNIKDKISKQIVIDFNTTKQLNAKTIEKFTNDLTEILNDLMKLSPKDNKIVIEYGDGKTDKIEFGSFAEMLEAMGTDPSEIAREFANTTRDMLLEKTKPSITSVLVDKFRERLINARRELVERKRITYYTIKAHKNVEGVLDKLDKSSFSGTGKVDNGIPQLQYYKVLTQKTFKNAITTKNKLGISPKFANQLVEDLDSYDAKALREKYDWVEVVESVDENGNLVSEIERLREELRKELKGTKYTYKSEDGTENTGYTELSFRAQQLTYELLGTLNKELNNLISEQAQIRRKSFRKADLELRTFYNDEYTRKHLFGGIQRELDYSSSPISVIKSRFGSNSAIAQQIQNLFNALDKHYLKQNEFVRDYNDLKEKHHIKDSQLGKRITFRANGKDVKITRDVLLDIYAMTLTEDTLLTLQQGGYSFDDGKTHWEYQNEDINTIKELLTDDEIAFVEDVVKTLYNGKYKTYKAQADSRIKGFEILLPEGLYYPSNKSNVDLGYGSTYGVIDIEHTSINQARKNVHNLALRGMGFTTRLQSYVNAVTKYGEMSEAVKVFADFYKGWTKNDLYEKSGKSRIALLSNADNVIADIVRFLTKQINGDASTFHTTGSKLWGNFITATLFGNPSVVLKQTGSLPTILNEVHLQSFLKAFPQAFKNLAQYRKIRQELIERSGIFAERVASGDVIKAEVLKTYISKIANLMGVPMEKMDEAIIVTFAWAAAQNESAITGENPIDILNRLIANTQSNAISLQISMNRAGATGSLRYYLSLFSSDLQNRVSMLNVLLNEKRHAKRALAQIEKDISKVEEKIVELENDLSNAISEKEAADIQENIDYQEEKLETLKEIRKDKEEILNKNTKVVAAKLIASSLMTGAIMALIAELVKRLLGKKDWKWDEETTKTFMQTLILESTIENLPYISIILNALENEQTLGGQEFTYINQIVEVARDAINVAKGDTSWKTLIRDMAFSLGSITGIPFNNIYKYTMGLLKNFTPNGEGYKLDAIIRGYTPNFILKEYKDAISTGFTRKANGYLDLVLSTRAEVSETAKTELNKLYASGYNALPSSYMTSYTDSYGNKVDLTKEQISQFRELYNKSSEIIDKTIESDSYRKLTQEEQAKILKKIYDMYYEYARAKVLGKETDISRLAKLLLFTKGNINLSRIVLVMNTLQKIEPTRTKTRKELVVAYVNRLGMSRANKLLLLKLMGYSTTEANTKTLRRYLLTKGMNRKQVEAFLG